MSGVVFSKNRSGLNDSGSGYRFSSRNIALHQLNINSAGPRKTAYQMLPKTKEPLGMNMPLYTSSSINRCGRPRTTVNFTLISSFFKTYLGVQVLSTSMSPDTPPRCTVMRAGPQKWGVCLCPQRHRFLLAPSSEYQGSALSRKESWREPWQSFPPNRSLDRRQENLGVGLLCQCWHRTLNWLPILGQTQSSLLLHQFA